MKKVLFYRDFGRFTGGHLKVWDYFNHVRSSPDHTPMINFSPGSIWDMTNPWHKERENTLSSWQPENADILFLTGLLDWPMIDERYRSNYPKPVICLTQNMQHSDPKDNRYGFLRYKAIRICISTEVQESITRTGHVNGPVFTIPVGLDFSMFPKAMAPDKRPIDILISGSKNPEMAKLIYDNIASLGKRTVLLTEQLPRHDFLDQLSKARIAICLPMLTEGSYLPPLEGMYLDTLIICPSVPGTHTICKPELNCFSPSYTLDGIISSLSKALDLSNNELNVIQEQAKATVTDHLIAKERTAFLDILNNAEELFNR
jgi:hypothetical protein